MSFARFSFVLSIISLFLIVQSSSADQQSAVEEVKQTYAAVEGQLPTARPISFLDGEGEGATEVTGWFDQQGQLIKMKQENSAGDPMLDREISFRPDGSTLFVWQQVADLADHPEDQTRIAEVRLYFAKGGGVVRALKKEAAFSPEEEWDMAGVKNETISSEAGLALVGERAELNEDVGQAENRFEQIRNPPFVRAIQGTTSPNGKFALAWAPDSGSRSDVSADGEVVDGKPVHNYLIDRARSRPIAVTAGAHFFDAAEIGQIGSRAIWSSNSEWLLELTENKWGVMTAALWHISPEMKVSNPIDVLEVIAKPVLAALEKGRPATATRYKDGEPFVPTFQDVTLSDDGVLSFLDAAMIPHDRSDGDSGYFSARVRIKPTTSSGAITVGDISVTDIGD